MKKNALSSGGQFIKISKYITTPRIEVVLLNSQRWFLRPSAVASMVESEVETVSQAYCSKPSVISNYICADGLFQPAGGGVLGCRPREEVKQKPAQYQRSASELLHSCIIGPGTP